MNTPKTPEDEEANYFAMQLLVPDAQLRAAVQKLGFIDLHAEQSLAQKLAKQFGVSENIVIFRLRELHAL